MEFLGEEASLLSARLLTRKGANSSVAGTSNKLKTLRERLTIGQRPVRDDLAASALSQLNLQDLLSPEVSDLLELQVLSLLVGYGLEPEDEQVTRAVLEALKAHRQPESAARQEMISYPGNPSLTQEIQDRISCTFEQTLDLAADGKDVEALIGCDYVLRLDPDHQPAKTLKERLKNGPRPVIIHDLRGRRADH